MADLIENCRRHRGMIGLLTVLGALLLGARAQQQEFRLVGSDVTLVPKYTGDLREIKWTLNGSIFVEFVLKPQEEFTHNLPNDRTTINKANGALTIRNLTIGDSGLYRAEAMVIGTEDTEIRLTVRDCPDQPTISVQSTKDQFVVSCKSSSPNVTYEWFNQTTSVSESQLYTEPKKNGTLTCVVDNKVCKENSSINFYILDQPEEKSEGNDVTLVPQYTGHPSEIIWKVDGNELVKMVLKPWVDRIFYYHHDRVTISHTDRSLTIRGLTKWDSGNYTAEVLVNNDYYYTEIRLESSRLSEDEKAGIIGVLVLITAIFFLLLWYCCCRKSEGPSEVVHAEYSDLPGSDVNAEPMDPSEGKDDAVIIKPKNDRVTITVTDTETVRKITWKKGGNTLFEWTVSHLKLYANNIFLKPGSMYYQKPGLQPLNSNSSTAPLMEKSIDINDKVAVVVHNTEKETKIIGKKGDDTLFEWKFSGLKIHTDDITLEPESVTVENAQGDETYTVQVHSAEEHSTDNQFQNEEYPPIHCVIHPIRITKTPITCKKDGQQVTIDGKRIISGSNGELRIKNVTSEDKGEYTVQYGDQEFIFTFLV